MDKNDLSKLHAAIPVIGFFEMRADVEQLTSTVERLEKVVDTLVNLYREERVKTWELVLNEMAKDLDQKRGDKNGIRTRGLGPKSSNFKRPL